MTEKPIICIIAPPAIANFILAEKVGVLYEKCPSVSIWLNPDQIPEDAAVLSVNFEPPKTDNTICRNIGKLTSKTYRHCLSQEISVLPDMVAGLDPNFRPKDQFQRPIINTLWLTVSKKLLLFPGIRQSMDWIESCILGLTWLNDPTHS